MGRKAKPWTLAFQAFSSLTKHGRRKGADRSAMRAVEILKSHIWSGRLWKIARLRITRQPRYFQLCFALWAGNRIAGQRSRRFEKILATGTVELNESWLHRDGLNLQGPLSAVNWQASREKLLFLPLLRRRCLLEKLFPVAAIYSKSVRESVQRLCRHLCGLAFQEPSNKRLRQSTGIRNLLLRHESASRCQSSKFIVEHFWNSELCRLAFFMQPCIIQSTP